GSARGDKRIEEAGHTLQKAAQTITWRAVGIGPALVESTSVGADQPIAIRLVRSAGVALSFAAALIHADAARAVVGVRVAALRLRGAGRELAGAFVLGETIRVARTGGPVVLEALARETLGSHFAARAGIEVLAVRVGRAAKSSNCRRGDSRAVSTLHRAVSIRIAGQRIV